MDMLVNAGDERVGPRAVLFEAVSARTISTRGRWDAHERAVLALLHGPGANATSVPIASNGSNGSNGPWIVWRLLSANNRELGRGVGAFTSSANARLAVEQTIAHAHQLESVCAFDMDRGEHAWGLRLDQSFVLIAPRWHRSRRANRENLMIAVASLQHTRISMGVTLLSR